MGVGPELACDAWSRGTGTHLLPAQPVDEGRLAHVGKANHRHTHLPNHVPPHNPHWGTELQGLESDG